MESWNKLKSFVTPKGISFQTLRSLASLVFKRPNLYWRGLATTNLAEPKDTGLYSTAPVDVKLVPMYTEVVKNKMYLNLIRQKCKKMTYETAEQFETDLDLIKSNARLFNKSVDVR
ncbi:Bromodomain adjacent to zinc finger domain protein 2A [Gracilariopsis chorda]|uniref:Bromodomain adjacent to zinc finger domain protein 2A n=1 Tax=Gracilariopsis chorda TaxID=448386 RepID=A0A2V3IV33_9FLOR|nr:Bromodomain adjacent to zinc finger domain protein 2A [Gracilariopsis chorda]|eukprot:PXF45000.1 Bromodomain adjacent to zinc finger domain protein 2A [Gracilariopsis chorda]